MIPDFNLESFRLARNQKKDKYNKKQMKLRVLHNFINQTTNYRILTQDPVLPIKEQAVEEPIEEPTVVEEPLPQGILDALNHFKKIALFSAMDHRLFRQAAVCFQSYQTHNPGRFDLFIITRDEPTPEIRKLCETVGIQFILLDLSEEYPIERDWPYPSECFWNFIGPQIFADLGYQYSMSVDPDTICLDTLDWDWLPNLKYLAAAPKLDEGKVIYNQWKPRMSIDFLNKIDPKKGYQQLGTPNPNQPAINPGVIVYHNHNLKKHKFSTRIQQLYQRARELQISIRGDDSLLNLWALLNPKYQYLLLSPTWNYYYLQPNCSKIPIGVKILHQHKIKPWNPAPPNSIHQQIHTEWNQTLNWIQDAHRPLQPWWYRPQPGGGHNWGDELTPWILEKLTGKQYPNPAPSNHPDTLLAVGSILRLSGPHTQIWGSGIRDREQSDFRPPARVHAVRGPLTRENLLHKNIPTPKIWGDPALLLPLLYNPTPPKRYPIGIIPHVVDYQLAQQLFPNYHIIDLNTTNITSVIDQLLSCETILSSSLHGLIAATAYGIPTRWIQLSNNIKGDGTKFHDFQQSLEPPQPDHQPLLLPLPQDLQAHTRTRPVPPHLAPQLLAALPPPLREALRARTPKK